MLILSICNYVSKYKDGKSSVRECKNVNQTRTPLISIKVGSLYQEQKLIPYKSKEKTISFNSPTSTIT